MTRYTYPAIITYYPDKGSYVADFPDFPGSMLFSIGIETLLGAMGDTLQHQIEADIRRGKPIPEPTTFEQHLHQDENCVSWWTIAHCDVNENFKRIMAGLHEVAESAFHANRPVPSDNDQ